jgi:hypothetical protein
MSNVSMSGAWIKTNLEVPARTRIDVAFASARSSGREVPPVAAHIVRKGMHGIGLEWRELVPRSVSKLSLLLSAAAIPARLLEQSARGVDAYPPRSAQLCGCSPRSILKRSRVERPRRGLCEKNMRKRG